MRRREFITLLAVAGWKYLLAQSVPPVMTHVWSFALPAFGALTGRPLEGMAVAAGSIHGGDMSVRVTPSDGRGEVGQLPFGNRQINPRQIL